MTPPKLVTPLSIFLEISLLPPPCSEMGDETKLWDCFGNHLIHFLIFGFGTVSSDTSIQEFLLLYVPCILLEVKYISLDSNYIITVTKFLHIRVVICFRELLLNTKVFFQGSWQNLSVKINMEPFWRKTFTALTVERLQRFICHVCKQTNVSDLSFWVKLPGLYWVFFSMYLDIFINIWFQKWLGFLLMFFQTSNIEAVSNSNIQSH